MSSNSRTYNSFMNIKYALIGQAVSIIVSFIARIVFLKQLGEVYLGISSLFANIIGLLSLAELGVGNAINFSLYKPLAENDVSKIKSLMLIYKKAYCAIGIIVLFIGMCIIMPFLNVFMSSSDIGSVDNIHIIFVLYVFNSAISYFFSFRRALLIADQKKYISTIYQYIFFIIMNILQIIFLITTKSFICYILIMIVCTIAENVSISRKVIKIYPFLTETDIEKLNADEMNIIKRNTYALMYHRVGSTVINSTDNILISKLLGIVLVGKYSNYQLITNTLNSIIAQLFSALTASIGNVGVTASNEKAVDVFHKVFFANFCICAIVSSAIYSTANILIGFWVGGKMILDKKVLVCIVINFYLFEIRKTVLTFKDAYGVYWNDRFKALFEALFNLVISIVLGLKLGLLGILLGTIFSTLMTSIWIEPYVLFKYGLKKNITDYIFRISVYSLISAACCVICGYLVGMLKLNGIMGFIIGNMVCVAVVSAVICLMFYRTVEFTYFYTLLKEKIKVIKS